MNIDNIKVIGRRLREEIPPRLDALIKGPPVGKGAGGDMTHPIDKQAENIIIEELQRLDEPVTLVSEECGVIEINGGGPRLLVDPIDGSRNAISGIQLFSSSIALIDGETLGSTVIGYILNFMTGDEYWAVKGSGSFLNREPIKSQSGHACKVIAYETPSPRKDLPAILPLLSLFNRVRCFGSTALDMSYLSQGAISMFIVPSPSRSFDFAAGYLLVKEAGGVVTNHKGEHIDNIPTGVKRATSLLASANSALHKKALKILGKQA